MRAINFITDVADTYSTWDNTQPRIQASCSNDRDSNSLIKSRIKEMEKENNTVLSFDYLEKELRELGIRLTEMRSEVGEPTEITCLVDSCRYGHSSNKKSPRGNQSIKQWTPVPKKVIFSGPATTILWMDGTKTTVRCSDEDVWDDEVGIAMCYLKKMLGNKGNYNNIFREAMKVAVVMEPKTKTASVIDSSVCVSSVFDNMSENIDKINKCMKDAADALSKVVKEKE